MTGELAGLRRFRGLRLLGTVGASLVAVGGYGCGALPVATATPLSGFRTLSLGCALVGMALLVLCWLWLPGTLAAAGASGLRRLVLAWSVPLALAPPLFSRDVYSYLAQGRIALLGLDPYRLGPLEALGARDPVAANVSGLWQHTPSPYGPLFVSTTRGIAWLSGEHVILGLVLLRLIELVAVALMVWALPRLARRCRAAPTTALWLGAANPLLLWHLVAGAHNDALMLGLMMAGLAMVAAGVARGGRVGSALLVGGLVVITLGACVKVVALLALAFCWAMLARRWGGRRWGERLRHVVLAAGLVAVIALAVLAVMSFCSGLGIGWIRSVSTVGSVDSWLAPTNEAGFLAGFVGGLLGFGGLTQQAIGIATLVGMVAAVVVGGWLLWRALAGALRPMLALGLCAGVVVVLGPEVQPWYLLWAVVPLAVAAPSGRIRTVAVVASAVVAVVLPPTGGSFAGQVTGLVLAYLVALLVAAVVAVLLARRLGSPCSGWRTAQPRDFGLSTPRLDAQPDIVCREQAGGHRDRPRQRHGT